MITIEMSEEADDSWNDRLLKSKTGTIYQTSAYGTYVQALLHAPPFYITFLNLEGKIIAQVLLHKSFRGKGKITSIFGRGKIYSIIAQSTLLPPYFYWNYGPIIFDSSYTEQIMEKFGEFLINQKCKFKGFPHPLDNNTIFPPEFNFKISKIGTFVIDLSQELNVILEKTDKRSVQKNIKRSKERGVEISEINTEKDLITYYEILHEFRKENNLPTYTYDDVIEGFNYVKDYGQLGFLAWYNKKPSGGIFFSAFNGYINEWGIARTKIDQEKKLYSIDHLRWNIIEWGKANNCRFYDLSGVVIQKRTEKDNRIFRNKSKWGGSLIEYPSFNNL